ncbi:MAG TPA: rhodanese [Cytophagales bacterium]|nr:rhodanese [Cytophagales bacterium]HAA20647.1 rhodanese [Cytophagales bacterium]HAP59382.1 rhodanese [Cytophagales bacterium]
MTEQIKHYEERLSYQWDAADLAEELEKDPKLVVIDTRKGFAYEEEHIPGAISFPHRNMDEAQTAQLDKTLLYICYCDGIGCNGSTKGALKLARLGFQVRELIGGLDWWKRDGYATEGTKAVGGTQIECAC